MSKSTFENIINEAKDRIIEIVNHQFQTQIDEITSTLRDIVEIMNLYIKHQDKKYAKVFKEGVYCDLTYNNKESFLPIVVFKSKYSKSTELRLTTVPNFSFYADDDALYAMEEALSAELKINTSKLFSRIYLNIIKDPKIYDGEKIINRTAYNQSLKLAFDKYFNETSPYNIAHENSTLDFDPCDSEKTHIVLEMIKSRNLHNDIFLYEADLQILRQIYFYSKDEIMDRVAICKYGPFYHENSSWSTSSEPISKNVLKYIINTDDLFIVIDRSRLKMVDLNRYLYFARKKRYKGIIKNIHVLFRL